jgi:ABC-type dipeptide/oligopeptide/nickel transport system permease subunit/energy-coupling factor transporter ATP-binding protein EcfA2
LRWRCSDHGSRRTRRTTSRRCSISVAHGAPSWAHPFGTDRNGYDVLTRVIYGAPTALAVGLGAMLVASLIGIPVGGLAGYLGGIADELLMRLTEFFLVIPVFVMILAVVRLFGIVVVGTWLERVPFLNLATIVLLLGLFGWPPIARLARAEFLRLKGMDFVEAARCIGAQPRDILFRHILPNALPSLAVVIALGIGGAILAESMISFLGFGDPKAISWGQLLYFNYQVLGVALGSPRARHSDLHHRAGLQSAGRWPVRRIQPATETMTDLLTVDGLRVHFFTRSGVAPASTASISPSARRDAGPGRRIRQRQNHGQPRGAASGAATGAHRRRIVYFQDRDLLALDNAAMRALRGKSIAMIFQNPAFSLNPILTIGAQLIEILRWHDPMSRAAARDRAAELLRLVGIADPLHRLRQFPHELSGGMKQRICIARALLCNPR